jgi:uncharacterized glyoxalase superfamily protein PhnB
MTTLLRSNRSMPPGLIIPVLGYRDLRSAVEWLCHAFGFTERLRIGLHRVQLTFGNASMVAVNVRSEGTGAAPPDPGSHSVMMRVPDADVHCRHARAAGARIISEPADYPYGERQYTAEDVGGHRWTFSQTIGDVDPADWGGELLA